MPVPEATRVTFAKNPLNEVVTQLKFPRLLELDAELPVQYQKSLQDDFPLLSAGRVFQVTIDPEAGAQSAASEGRRYEFFTKDRKWQAVLTSEFVALSTSEYKSWEEFRHRTKHVVSAFLECYKPAQFDRIGLRYRDSISRTRLNLEGVSWGELLQPHILGALAAPGVEEEELIGYRGSFALRLGSLVKVQVTHGIVTSENKPEYMIDSDFFVDQPTEANPDAAISVLESFRPHTNNLFHWCVTRRLFDAMAPEAVPIKEAE